ncbi:MAG: hypothetical protein MSG64_05590 [Pyrinomonadaceae bacterium MAG19_C2-C3]|nr:hypothetical protein [Pyrinomonadaceae bacterium MAG19_C2-C3]
MSEDPTKRFESESKVTQPMLETLVREFRAFRTEVNDRLTHIEQKFDDRLTHIEQKFDDRIDRIEQKFDDRVDRIEATVSQTRADVLNLRTDFREFRTMLRESLPSLVK